MPEFSEIDLSESYLLGWAITPDTIEFQLDAVLCPGHSDYQLPPPTEWACYRPGRLLFHGVQSLVGLPPQSEVRPSIGADGELDYGCIDSLSRNGDHFELEGDFGSASFTAKGFNLVLDQA